MYEEYFKNKPAYDKWQRIGFDKKAGVCIPLFSIYSNKSLGIGEIPDLKHVIDWCSYTGLSIILLLPLNDTGSSISPYSSDSSFALDPIYISLDKLNKKYKLKHLEASLKELRNNTEKTELADYSIKQVKIEMLKSIFEEVKHRDKDEFDEYKTKNSYWLQDYCLYKVIKNKYEGSWETWDDKVRDKDDEICNEILIQYDEEINFYAWVQYCLYQQLSEIKQYAGEKKIFIMGDIPFLVSRDSADTWANKKYFRFELASGAPPDMYFSEGQKWGMPAYNWDEIRKDNFEYITERLKYAENFYDLYRIDHFIGLFRIWVTDTNEDSHGALNGRFEPSNEDVWYEHGARIIKSMLDSTNMMPCAEDLGTVPQCSFDALDKFGITGIDFQRYNKHNYDFLKPCNYRINSCTVISTHDSTHFSYWWDNEAGTIDESLFDRLYLRYRNEYELNAAKERLFDRTRAENNRLFWREEMVDTEDKFLWELQLPREQAWELLEMYRTSFRERDKFIKFLQSDISPNNSSNAKLAEAVLNKAFETRSIFSIQLITDLLLCDQRIHDKINNENYRFNTPGIINDINWRVKLPFKIESLKRMKVSEKIKKLLKESERCPE